MTTVKTYRKMYRTVRCGTMTVLDDDVKSFVAESEVVSGHILIFVAGVSAGITISEAEPGIMTHDLEHLFASGMGAPYGPGFVDGAPYKHHETWGCDNGASHLRSLLIGPSATIPFDGGHLLLGPWQNVLLVECDTNNRERIVVFQIMGVT